MNLLKRTEVWALLAVVTAGLVWVFLSGRASKDEALDSGGTTGVDSREPLQLHRCVLKRDYGNARLDIEVHVRNDAAERLVMQTPRVKLLGENGREIPSYFLPFDPVPEVAAKSELDVQLRYWLEAADLNGGLSLKVDAKQLTIKGPTAFDLKSMENGEEKVFQPGAW